MSMNTDSFINSLSSLSLLTGVEHYNYNRKDILVFDDHRTTLAVLFEAHRLGVFDGQIPNIVTFDYHEDCCEVPKKSELMKMIGATDLDSTTSRQFWSFVEFDISKVDDDWIAVAQELNLAKDVTIIGNVANHNVDNNEVIKDEDGNEHRRFSIPHLSFSLDNRGCLGDSMIKEQYYTAVRDTLQYHGWFDNAPVYPYVLDIDLDCFSADLRDKMVAWPKQMFVDEFFSTPERAAFINALINRASLITISREPGCCGGMGESHKILQYLDKYWFEGVLNTMPME